ncbi:MAG: MurR/RpiR family transcriptional regulator [Chloroflexota bacterium]
MSLQELLGRIDQHLPELSRGQRKVAQFIRDNYQKIAFLPAAKVGEMAGVSESTVIRLASALGYDGYVGLQEVAQHALRGEAPLLKLEQSAASIAKGESVLARVVELDRENLRRIISSVGEADLQRAVDMILRAERIYVIGLKNSSPLAFFLGLGLNSMLEKVTILMSGSGDLPEQLATIKQGDCAICIGFPRYCRETVYALKYAQGRGAATIAITDGPTSPLAQWADLAFGVPAESLFYVNSYVAPMSLVNAILAAVSLRDRDRLVERLRQIERIYSDQDVYYRS